MKYKGCVTDIEWKRALCEQYPDKKARSPDSQMRRKISFSKVDVPGLAQKFQERKGISGLSGIKKLIGRNTSEVAIARLNERMVYPCNHAGQKETDEILLSYDYLGCGYVCSKCFQAVFPFGER